MNRLLYSIDRWAPAAVSLLALFLVAGGLWVYSVRIARLEGQVEALQHQADQHLARADAFRGEAAALRTWAIAVHERGSAVGWKLPDVPTATAPPTATPPTPKPPDKERKK